MRLRCRTFLHLFTIFVICTALTTPASASLQCSKLFSDESISASASDIRNRALNKGFSDLSVPELSDDLNIMLTHLNELLVDQGRLSQSGFAKADIDKLIVMGNQIKMSTVKYKDYIRFSLKYVLLMELINNFRPDQTGKPNFRTQSLTKKFINDEFIISEMTKFIENLYPHFIFIFTHRNTPIKEFNPISGENVFYVGLTHKPLDVDFTEMPPFLFSKHDIYHAFQYLLAQYPDFFKLKVVKLFTQKPQQYIEWNTIELTKPLNPNAIQRTSLKVVNIRETIFNKLKKEKNAQLTHAINAIWFHLFHEMEVSINWENILKMSDGLLGLTYTQLIAQESFYSEPTGTTMTLKMSYDDLGKSSDEQTYNNLRGGLIWLKELALQHL